jgi:hypothetical protein
MLALRPDGPGVFDGIGGLAMAGVGALNDSQENPEAAQDSSLKESDQPPFAFTKRTVLIDEVPHHLVGEKKYLDTQISRLQESPRYRGDAFRSWRFAYSEPGRLFKGTFSADDAWYSLSVDREGRIFVAGQLGVMIFDPGGQLLRLPKFYNSSLGPFAFRHDEGTLYIPNELRIDKHDLVTGEKKAEIGTTIISGIVPSGIAVDQNTGNLYIADYCYGDDRRAQLFRYEKWRILVFDADDSLLADQIFDGQRARLVFADGKLWAASDDAFLRKGKLICIDPDNLEIINEYKLPSKGFVEDIICYRDFFIIPMAYDIAVLLVVEPATGVIFTYPQSEIIDAVAIDNQRLLAVEDCKRVVAYDIDENKKRARNRCSDNAAPAILIPVLSAFGETSPVLGMSGVNLVVLAVVLAIAIAVYRYRLNDCVARIVESWKVACLVIGGLIVTILLVSWLRPEMLGLTGGIGGLAMAGGGVGWSGWGKRRSGIVPRKYY